VEEGFEAVLSRKQRATPAVARIFDGEKEAKLIALACSKPPKGRARWTLRLLEKKVVGIEACGTSHHWARELIKLGHEVRLMPPAYVKPYVKRGKTDAADAEAVCEAVTRPTMRFVPVKSPEQQAALSMHRTRDLLVKQRTQLINMIRGLLAEFGVDIPKGLERALLMARQIVDGNAPEVPIEAAKIVTTLSQQALDIHGRLREIDRDLAGWLRGNDVARRLMTIPGIGPVGATALAASVSDPHQFRSGRQFAAWLGLTPLQKSSGGKERLGRISKMGDKYLRKLLIVGMTSLVRRAKYNPGRSIHAWRICWRESPQG
jgi:transposase